MEESLDDCLKKVLRKVLADSASGSFPQVDLFLSNPPRG
jgi:hypothetical protein